VRHKILSILVHRDATIISPFIYCKATLHISDVVAPIFRSTYNCNYSLRYKSYYRCSLHRCVHSTTHNTHAALWHAATSPNNI